MSERAAARAAPIRALLAGAMIALGGSARALSLRSTKAEVFLGEARPGGTLTFSRATGAPLGVENAGGEPAHIELSAAIPPLQEVADGYESLPDVAWVRLGGATAHTLEPGRSAHTEIAVNIPKDARLLEGQYVFDCLIKGRSSAGSAVTLKTRLSFAVGDGDPPENQASPPAGFDVSPRAGRMDRVPLGRKTALRDEAFRGLKVINAGGRAMKVRLATLRAWPEDLRPPEGFVPAPNPRWLKPGPEMRVSGGAVREAALEIRIPDRPRYAGRKWSFLLAIDADDGVSRGRRLFMMSVTTAERSK